MKRFIANLTKSSLTSSLSFFPVISQRGNEQNDSKKDRLQEVNDPIDQSTAINVCPRSPEIIDQGVHGHYFFLSPNVQFNLFTSDKQGDLFNPRVYAQLMPLAENFSPANQEIINEKRDAIEKNPKQFNGLHFHYENIYVNGSTITTELKSTDYATFKAASSLTPLLQLHKMGVIGPCYSICPDQPTFNTYFAAELGFLEETNVDDFSNQTIYQTLHARKDTLFSSPSGFVDAGKNKNKLLYDFKNHSYNTLFDNQMYTELLEEVLLTAPKDKINEGMQELTSNRKRKYLIIKPAEILPPSLMGIRNSSFFNPKNNNECPQSVELFYPIRFHTYKDLLKLNNSKAPDANEHIPEKFEIKPIAHLTPLGSFLNLNDNVRESAKKFPGFCLWGMGTLAILYGEKLLNEKTLNEISTIFHDDSLGNSSCCFFSSFTDANSTSKEDDSINNRAKTMSK
jgi:hypothetical protein